MPSSQDFFLRGDQSAARAAVMESLTNAGWRVTGTPNGNIVVERGSLGLTIAFGALAGSKFHVSFVGEFFTGADGGLIVRLSRDMTKGALKGGALGMARVDRVFTDTINALGTDLDQRGLLESVTRA